MDIWQRNDVFMVHKLSNLISLRMHLASMRSSRHLAPFDSDFRVGFPVKCAYKDSVSAIADFVDVFIATVDGKGGEDLGRGGTLGHIVSKTGSIMGRERDRGSRGRSREKHADYIYIGDVHTSELEEDQGRTAFSTSPNYE